MWKCSPIHFYIFLDADFTLEDPQVGHGGLQDAPGAALWSVTFFFIVFVVLGFVLVTMNYGFVMKPYFA